MKGLIGRIARSARSEVRTIRRWRRTKGLVAGAVLLRHYKDAHIEWIEAAGGLTNPSITTFHGGTVVLARTVTYRLSRLRQRAVPLRGQPNPRTVVARTAGRFQALHLADGPNDEHLEDPRAFEWRGSLWGLWSKSKMLSPGLYRNSMVLGEVRDSEIHQVHPLSSPHNRAREKNWMPLVDGERLRFVYDLARLETYELTAEGLRLISTAQQDIPELRFHSGSSQFIAFRNGWIGVSHRNVMRPRTLPWLPYAYYWHYLVVLNQDFTFREVSRPFFFQRRGVEYCAGIAFDGTRIAFSFGVNDARAAVLRIPPARLAPLFRDPTALWIAS